MAQIELRGVSRSFSRQGVGLRPTDLLVPSGDRLALLGPSGSGKTTLLRLIAGLDTPDQGEIFVDGQAVSRCAPHERGVSFLPQRPALYPHLTIRENLEIVRPLAGKPPSVQQIADLLRLGSLLDRLPLNLSGGERQKAALARIVLRNAPIWLLDEPFANLDPMFREEFRHDLHLLIATAAATILLVTHDPTDATALGRRIGVLGDGTLQQLGTPEELRSHPGNRFVAFCLGNLSLLEGIVAGGDPVEFLSACGTLRLPIPHRVLKSLESLGRLGPQAPLTLGLRPEDVHLGNDPTPTGRAWTVTSAEPVGSGWLLLLTREHSRVRCEWRSGSPPAVGFSTDWSCHTEHAIWFDGHSGKTL